MLSTKMHLQKIFGSKRRAFRLVSKFIFSSFSHKFFVILHIVIDSNDLKQIRVVSAVKKNSAPKGSLFRLISKLFLSPNSFSYTYTHLIFSDIVYFDRLWIQVLLAVKQNILTQKSKMAN